MESTPGSATKDEGLRLLKAGQVDEAIALLKKAVQEDPEDASVHCYLGVAYNQKHDKLHAIAEFEECLRLEETPKAYYNLGQIYESVHRVDEAIRQYRMAVDLDANYTQAQQALDRLHSRFEAEHPELAQTVVQAEPTAQGGIPAAAVAGAPASPEPTMIGKAPTRQPGAPQPTQAMPAQPAYPGGPQGGPVRYGGPPPATDQRLQKQLEVQEQQAKMIRSGLIYGIICGALFKLLINVVLGMWLLPGAVMVGAGSGVLLMMVLGIVEGAVAGGLIGLWVGYTCGGESAGFQAGAVIGGVYSLLMGLISGQGGFAIISMLVGGLFMGIFGYIIGRMVDASIGWD